ncbi:MAG: STAS domain-containing protein [Bacteroidia bacterium]|nr:STAS domain-containing protein [Bacteroidia bacterium]
MENKLDIRKDPPGKEQRVYLEGRLDANWAGHLEDYLNSLIREGSYHLVLNMAGVQYISSAGIRILVNQYKKIKKIGGSFILEALSTSVSEVLEMVGMKGLLTEGAPKNTTAEKVESQFLEIKSYRYDNEVVSNEQMTLRLTGNPGLALTSGFTATDNQKIKFAANQYGLGIGAIGDGFEDCKSRYGEFLAIGEALVYKPSDGSKIPDYMVKTGKLEPEINTLCSIQAEGVFSNRITFEPLELNPSISLADLASGFAQTTGHKQFVFLVIAEIGGLVGMSLSTPPVDRKLLFEFPGIRENISFTTEPAYSRMLTVSLGFYALAPEEPLKSFLRPVKPGSSALIHTHTAVFPFQVLPKNETSAGKLLIRLLESSIAQDVLHLIHDSREIAGLGDSTFKQGVAWVGKFS